MGVKMETLKPENSQWRSAMLKMEKRNLKALVRNYLQPGPDEASPEKLVSQLAEYLQKTETQERIIALLDDFDLVLIGLVLLKGSLSRQDAILILRGEVSEYELDFRLDSLVERLVLYLEKDAIYNLTPFFKQPLLFRWTIQDLVFGTHHSGNGPAESRYSLQDLFISAAFIVKFEPSLFRKNGQLTARAVTKLQQYFKTDEQAPEIIKTIIADFEQKSFLSRKDHSAQLNEDVFARFLLDSAANNPLSLVLTPYPEISTALLPFLSHAFRFSGKGLMRFLRILAIANSIKIDPSEIVEKLTRFGLLLKDNDDYICIAQRARMRGIKNDSLQKPQLLIDGTGIIHLLPDAGLDVFLALLKIAELRSAAQIWSFEITRESAKKAFAEGYAASGILDELANLAQGSVPEMLAMTLESWEREHVSLRIMKGYVVSFDDEMAGILEAGKAFDNLRVTRLAKNLVFLDNHQAKLIPEILGKIGLPIPPVMTSSGSDHGKPLLPALEARASALSNTVRNYAGSSEFAIIDFDRQCEQEKLPLPKDSLSLRQLLEELSAMETSDRIRSVLEERIRRKLIISAEQLQMLKADMEHDERLGRAMNGGHSAEGLNFQGKLHIIKGALKNKKARLTVQWISEGRELKTEMRPASLEKTDKDYLLTGEDLASHSPLTLRVGTIRYLALSEGIIS